MHNLFSPSKIKNLLSKQGSRPSKGLGQNFLIDKNVLEKIIKTANINPDNVVLEVGPGIGTLTQELAKRAKKVIAVEKDEAMIKILSETLADHKNIEIINADILKLDPKPYTLNPYKVVANIPYYITSPLIRNLLENNNPPSEIILLVQKEVAQRICSKPSKMSLLSVSVQFYAEPQIISYVSKNCFWPAPKVDSAIIKITPNVGCRTSHNSDLFFKIVRAGFSHPRKQLLNNLSSGLKLDRKTTEEWLKKNNISPLARAETLSVSDWRNLALLITQFD